MKPSDTPLLENHVNLVQRRRIIEYLFRKAGIRVKPGCLRCGRPFLVERPRFLQDQSAYCPDCKPRQDKAPNVGKICDCGAEAVVIVYLTIYHPGSPSRSTEPIPLCELCAIDELLALLKRRI